MNPHPHFQQRTALTTPETLGVVACLCAGLIAGFWLFGEDLNQLEELATSAPQHSTPAKAVGAPSTHEAFEGELDSRLDQHDRPETIPTAEYKAETGLIDKAAVAALLHEDAPPNAASREPTGQTRTAFKIPRQENLPAEQESRSAEALNEEGQRTLAYWNAMNTIMAQEGAMRTAPAAGINQTNAGDFINRRGQAGNYAAGAFRDLDTTGVDPAVVRLSQDIANWYAAGARLNDTAGYLLNRASANTRRGQTGKNWADSEKAHNANVQEINRRGDQLRAELSQKYGLAFPDLR